MMITIRKPDFQAWAQSKNIDRSKMWPTQNIFEAHLKTYIKEQLSKGDIDLQPSDMVITLVTPISYTVTVRRDGLLFFFQISDMPRWARLIFNKF